MGEALGEALSEARNSDEAKKFNDISKKLEDLYAALGNRFVNASNYQQLLVIAEAVEKQDAKAAQKSLQEIVKNDFQNTKSWVPALKQLFKLCETCWACPSMY